MGHLQITFVATSIFQLIRFFIQVLVTCRLSYIIAANIRDDQGPRLDFSTDYQGEQIEVKLAQVEVPVSQS